MEKERCVFVDYLKGISITGVVLFHLIFRYTDVPTIVKTASNFGGAGVHIFIVASGFGLALSQMRKQLPWKAFMIKRFSKVYIPYIAIVLISFCIPYMYLGNNRIGALLSHIFLFKMFVPQFEDTFGGQFWFVSTIFQFYVIFTLLFYMKKKVGGKRFIILCSIVSFLWATFTTLTGLYEERVWNSFFLQYLWEFAVGMYCADLYLQKPVDYWKKYTVKKVLCVAVISLGIYMFMALKGGLLKSYNDVFSLLAYGGISMVLYQSSLLRRIFIWINTFSYELYLIHILIFTSSFYVLSSFLANICVSLIALITSYIGAYIFHVIMQQKFINAFLTDLLKKRKTGEER